MKVMLTFFSMYVSLTSTAFATKLKSKSHQNRVLILVPGTLNSIVPGSPDQYLNPTEPAQPYFSSAIINEFRSQFDAVHITPGLDYFGNLKKNGRRVYQDTLDWYKEYSANLEQKPEIWIFGHSAGGLYSLYATHLNNKYDNILPIKKITMLSTPLRGVEFIDKITRLPFIFEKVAAFFLNSSWPLDLRGLWELKKENVEIYLSELTLTPNIQLDAFSGNQNSPSNTSEIFDSHFLSPPLTAIQKLINSLSDGIVSENSALTDPRIATTDGSELRIKSHPEYIVPLDHVEQVWDYRYLKAFGTLDTEYVLSKQIESCRTILSTVEAQ